MSKQRWRLERGGRVDRSRSLWFSFNGKRYEGYIGDTLASALLANGIHLVGRSFKYHRPRGILSAGSEEPNGLVQLNSGAHTEPNLRATQVELYEGLEAASQNCWPSVRFDLGAINNALSHILPAGFYYKTFMWPKRFWRHYEHFIRKAAGLGRAPVGVDPDQYDKTHVHCDVLVVGAGPAGLAAARAAAQCGARVILVDEQSELGGSLLSKEEEINDKPAEEWITEVVDEVEGREEVSLLSRTTVTGYYDHNYLIAAQRITDHVGPGKGGHRPKQRLWKIRAKQVVLATGALERPIVFHNNDRPGVMLASAAQCYVNRYAVSPGRRAVVFTNNDSAYRVVRDLLDAGIAIVALVDTRPKPKSSLTTVLRSHGVEILNGYAVVAVLGTNRVRRVEVMALDESGRGITGAPRTVACDFLCMSGGWSPVVHLFSQSRGRLEYDRDRACFVPAKSVQHQRSVGGANGHFELAECLHEGHAAGIAAAADAGFREMEGLGAPSAKLVEAAPLRPCWMVPRKGSGGPTNKHFVDFQNDVTATDIALAAREGYRSVEHLKRYTTIGMGTDQGKTGNINALAILGQTLSEDIPVVGTTTFRPPYTPLTFGTIAGRDVGELADSTRLTSIHQWHVTNGTKFEDVGQWKRPWYYPRLGESMHDAVNRESLATRNAIGILDASTLGKIDIQGPDAVELLDRIYTNSWKTLAIGRCRYGIMCGEDGMVFDDGVTSRIGENHYWMTTTSGNAARVLAWLEEWLQTEWPELKVYCNSMTEHWATVAIAGPFARRLLAKLTDDIDLSAKGFAFMSHREGTVAGIRARVFRVSFTGESSYEINIPARYGLALWNALMTAGEEYGITPIGTETMHVLRAEKGYIIAGQDTDGTVTPIDLGMERMVSKHKDFVGKRSLFRSDTVRKDRKQLVGLLTLDPNQVLPEGGQTVVNPNQKPPIDMIGHVTSSYYSANLKRSIALGLVKGGRRRHGEIVHIPVEGKAIAATITQPQFYDPEGQRLRE
ncbi:MAG: sarcosine oxidase subunit alpha family protein [Acidiferrobacterales bacterium]